MKKLLIIISLILQITSFSQEFETNEVRLKQRYGIGFLPSTAENIYGLAIGIIGSEAICNKYYTKKSHGLNIQILGQGIVSPFYVFNDKLNFIYADFDSIIYGDSTAIKRVKHNGLILATFGTFSEEINGISISPWMSINNKVNGVSINALANNIHTINGLALAFYNIAYRTEGLQIGLLNRTKYLNGFQFGLWNVNNKRRLPILNWSFKERYKVKNG